MKTFLEPEEVTRLSEAATNLRDRLLIHLLFHLGCRISEALAITVEDIDLVKSTIIIQHLKTRLKLSCPKLQHSLSKKPYLLPQMRNQGGKSRSRSQRTSPHASAAYR